MDNHYQYQHNQPMEIDDMTISEPTTTTAKPSIADRKREQLKQLEQKYFSTRTDELSLIFSAAFDAPAESIVNFASFCLFDPDCLSRMATENVTEEEIENLLARIRWEWHSGQPKIYFPLSEVLAEGQLQIWAAKWGPQMFDINNNSYGDTFNLSPADFASYLKDLSVAYEEKQVAKAATAEATAIARERLYEKVEAEEKACTDCAQLIHWLKGKDGGNWKIDIPVGRVVYATDLFDSTIHNLHNSHCKKRH